MTSSRENGRDRGTDRTSTCVSQASSSGLCTAADEIQPKKEPRCCSSPVRAVGPSARRSDFPAGTQTTAAGSASDLDGLRGPSRRTGTLPGPRVRTHADRTFLLRRRLNFPRTSPWDSLLPRRGNTQTTARGGRACRYGTGRTDSVFRFRLFRVYGAARVQGLVGCRPTRSLRHRPSLCATRRANFPRTLPWDSRDRRDKNFSSAGRHT